MRIRVSFQTIIARSPLLLVGLVCLTFIWTTIYLYIRLYKPITQTETIIIIRSESSLQTIDFQAYERLKKLQEERFNLKPLDMPASLNPFVPKQTSMIEKPILTP